MQNTMYNKKPPEAQIDEIDEIVRGLSSPARSMWQRIKSYIENVENELDNDQEVLVNFLLPTLTQATEVSNISYWSPDMLIFECTLESSEKIILLQHYSQINFYLSVRKRQNPKRPAKRIGFTSETPNVETSCDSPSPQH